MQVYRQDSQHSKHRCPESSKLSSHGRRFRVHCRRNGGGQSLARETHCLQCKSSHLDKASMCKGTPNIIRACFAKYDSALVLEDMEHVGEDSARQVLIARFSLTPKPIQNQGDQSQFRASLVAAIPKRLGRGDGRIHSLEDLLSNLRVCQQLKALWVQRMSDMWSFPTLPTVCGTFAPTAIRFK